MKVLLINGSPRLNGNTSLALNELKKVFEAEGVETETVQVGTDPIRGCIACNACFKTGKCVYNDAVNIEADGKWYQMYINYASANGTLISFLDRLFYSTTFDKSMKVGAAVAIARRGGCSATYDEINKYFTISGMPVAPSQYWNSVHGKLPGEAAMDEEGLQTMRTLARNMTFLMKSIALGKEQFGLPEKEQKISTSFIR